MAGHLSTQYLLSTRDLLYGTCTEYSVTGLAGSGRGSGRELLRQSPLPRTRPSAAFPPFLPFPSLPSPSLPQSKFPPSSGLLVLILLLEERPSIHLAVAPATSSIAQGVNPNAQITAIVFWPTHRLAPAGHSQRSLVLPSRFSGLLCLAHYLP
ncbi:hypothetical protein BO71DRAFT_396867, partial [Aspergillus ellipticus CBS 707.79]